MNMNTCIASVVAVVALAAISACSTPCKTSTMRCKDRKAQVCMDKQWITARECDADCYMEKGMPTCLE